MVPVYCTNILLNDQGTKSRPDNNKYNTCTQKIFFAAPAYESTGTVLPTQKVCLGHPYTGKKTDITIA